MKIELLRYRRCLGFFFFFLTPLLNVLADDVSVKKKIVFIATSRCFPDFSLSELQQGATMKVVCCL